MVIRANRVDSLPVQDIDYSKSGWTDRTLSEDLSGMLDKHKDEFNIDLFAWFGEALSKYRADASYAAPAMSKEIYEAGKLKEFIAEAVDRSKNLPPITSAIATEVSSGYGESLRKLVDDFEKAANNLKTIIQLTGEKLELLDVADGRKPMIARDRLLVSTFDLLMNNAKKKITKKRAIELSVDMLEAAEVLKATNGEPFSYEYAKKIIQKRDKNTD